MDFTMLDNVVIDYPNETDLWEDFKFTDATFADTDEDWSVSEASSEADRFCLDSISGDFDDLSSGLLPDTKVHPDLSQLNLLASNTSSALSLPPFEADLQPLELKDIPKPNKLVTSDNNNWGTLNGKEDSQNQHDLTALDATQVDALKQHTVPESSSRLPPVRIPSSSSLTLDLATPKVAYSGLAAPSVNFKPAPKVLSSKLTKKRKPVKAEVISRPQKYHKVSATPYAKHMCSTPHIVKEKSAYDSSYKRGGKAGKHCEFCLEKFDNADLLQRHRESHMIAPNLFKCNFPECKKQYATGEGLRLHVRNVHLMAKNWKCLADGCTRSFVRQSDLRMHIIRMHSDIRPFPCPMDDCAKSFACHSELRRHVLSCHKMTCPKTEKIKSTKVQVDSSYIQGLMKKIE